MTYAAFAARLRATQVLSDPWVHGEPRFREEPIVLAAPVLAELYAAAEDMARLSNEVCEVVAQDPSLLGTHFALSPCQKLMWLASGSAWHGIARADVFRTAAGLKVCELNCDTPSGQAEAVLLGELARTSAAASAGARDPNAALLERYVAMVFAVARRARGNARRGDAPSVGILYPTEMTEDLSMVELYRQAFTRAGATVTLGSPYNLTLGATGRAALFGRECDVIVRHYKTDWWGEREPAWDDALPVPDGAPLAGPLGVALAAQAQAQSGRGTAFVNPFGAVVPQNKRAMALMWEAMHRFSPWAQEAIARLVPETRRLEAMPEGEVRAAKDAWVLKSDYGCEGAEVVMGDACTAEEWRMALDHAVPGRWVAQRRFVPCVETDAGESVNYGVYVVAGEACGVLARLQTGATDVYARTAPLLVNEEAPS
jgi:glutathionylspermidine synthase